MSGASSATCSANFSPGSRSSGWSGAVADRQVRRPVDRDHDARPQQRDGARRRARVEVPGAERAAPAPDRHQRDIERRQLRHPVEQVGVAREVDARAALDDEPERGHEGVQRAAAPVVLGRDRRDGSVLQRQGVAGVQLDHLADSQAPHDAGGAGGDDHRGIGREPAQRGPVRVVAVEVREQHGVEPVGRVGRRDVPAQVDDAGPQQRVGEHRERAELDQRGRVAEPADAVTRRLHRLHPPTAPAWSATRQRSPGRSRERRRVRPCRPAARRTTAT